MILNRDRDVARTPVVVKSRGANWNDLADVAKCRCVREGAIRGQLQGTMDRPVDQDGRDRIIVGIRRRGQKPSRADSWRVVC